MTSEYFDVVVVGAGLSGIGAAYFLQDKCPGKSYVVLDGRGSMGGTWDLFRYPGIRSDSDMYTLGYKFKPWRDGKAIADGPSILDYIRETSAENGIDEHIRYRHLVRNAEWSSDEAMWTIAAERSDTGETVTICCNFLLMCSGYYNYEQGYTPDFKGRERFRGEIIHPQKWPEDLDYEGKKVVVIGSGATAVTLVPELAEATADVTMLQRSPTYMLAMPETDWVAIVLGKILPAKTAYAIARWKNIGFQHFLYSSTRVVPNMFRRVLLKLAKRQLGPDCEFETNFTPSYNPWDQRLCIVPNADFFHAVRDGKASVVTDRIDTFTEEGILLESGEELKTDIIITATGLDLCVLGGVSFSVDGRPVDFSEGYSYKSMMFSDVPNLISTFGYINASWTLKADLTAEFACRVINHMEATGHRQCVPRLRTEDRGMSAEDWIQGFSSGYIQRKLHLLPKQGNRLPWINTQNYSLDKKIIGKGAIEDGVLQFSNPRQQALGEQMAHNGIARLPDTGEQTMDLAELIDNATQRGYGRNFAIDGDCLQCSDTGVRATVEECRIVDTLAVDTGTDPGDDATIYLIDTRTGAKGYLVVSDSFHTDPARAAFVDRLVAHSGGT